MREKEREALLSRHNTPRNGQSVSAKVGCSVGTLPERETRPGSACLLHRHDSLVQDLQRCKDRENARDGRVVVDGLSDAHARTHIRTRARTNISNI